MNTQQIIDMNNTHFKIRNIDKIWSSKKAEFVDLDTVNTYVINLDTEIQLIESLEIYNLEKGQYSNQEELLIKFSQYIQEYLDNFAKTRLYDSIDSACSYATSKDPVFQEEGQYCVDARSEIWRKGYEIRTKVLAGLMILPSKEELLQLLPMLAWPNERPEYM